MSKFTWEEQRNGLLIDLAASLEREDALQANVNELVEALELALSSHGVMLMSDPPQDAWKVRGVEPKARAALAKLGSDKTGEV